MFKALSTLLIGAALLASASAQATDATLAEDLIGEELITAANANEFADRAIAEAERIWASSSETWHTISTSDGVLNEGKAVSGVFAAAEVNITRATGLVDVPAQTLFDYLITATGYQLIDPTSNPEDFSKPPLESFSVEGWRGDNSTGKRLEAARTDAHFEGIRPREFVVFNAIDANSRIFVSKSIQHAGDPGCSMYGGASCFNASDIPVRVLNTFGVQIEPSPTNASQCIVQLINYADLTLPEIPAMVSNYVINLMFLPDMLARMRAAFP